MGTMRINKKPPHNTIDDVARLAGVSISTVSRVINRNVPVSDEVVAKVEAAMLELKYIPRAAARNLASRKTNTLGLLAAEVLGDFFSPLLSGIEGAVAEAGYDLLISTAARRGPHDHLPGSLGTHNTDGLLVFAGSLTSAGIEHTHALGLPMVLIHQSTPAHLPIPCVTIENKAAACAIVEHLIRVHGRRCIVLLRGLPKHEDAYWREVGYREALAQNGLAFDSSLVMPGDFNRDVARRSITRLLEQGVAFDAVFSGDDEAAVGALQALQARGKCVPDEVSVVGFDDQNLAAVINPPLTTVHTPTAEVGRAAAEQLLRLIRTEEADLLTLLPTELVIRRSCGCNHSAH
jgi:DNA-binding LacI/PurR family transcriptional regulator